MGQKVHPLGFRMNVMEDYNSKWFTNLDNYSNYLHQDYIIRQTIMRFFKKLNESKNIKTISDSFNIIDVDISRRFDFVNITTYIASTQKIIVDNKSNISSLLQDDIISSKIIDKLHSLIIKELRNSNIEKVQSSKIVLTLKETPQVDLRANFIAKCLADNLENRMPFRRALKNILKSVQKNKQLSGIKIQISGRLNGIEMARSEWVREGRIPLQTITASIDYCNDIAQTKYGLLGIKVWVYKK